jgi:GT2 family glycosyltransferase
VDWKPDKSLATIRYRAANYDYERMKQQPSDPPYLWCNITTMIPREWHFEIGGFDEAMPSWEDVDYWHRMARAGKGFFRITEPLLVYRFDTGKRRESGRHQWADLLDYMKQKAKR